VTDEVLLEPCGPHILVVKLNRPAARNAVNTAMTQAITAAIETSEADPAIRAVILTTTMPEVFCAGADLKELAAGRGGDLVTAAGGFAGFVRARRAKPWIAAVAGKALGGGLEFCLACDMVVAGRGASFGLPEVLRGIYAGAGGVFRLPLAIPRAIAFEMMTTGLPIDAARAYELGLVNRLVEPDDVLNTAIKLAESISKAAPIAVVETLALARIANQKSEQELWQLSDELGARLLKTEDYWEGPRAFAEKRSPVWKGR
jgi:enoyl-CoA hydratase/carnithine racemase